MEEYLKKKNTAGISEGVPGGISDSTAEVIYKNPCGNCCRNLWGNLSRSFRSISERNFVGFSKKFLDTFLKKKHTGKTFEEIPSWIFWINP